MPFLDGEVVDEGHSHVRVGLEAESEDRDTNEEHRDILEAAATIRLFKPPSGKVKTTSGWQGEIPPTGGKVSALRAPRVSLSFPRNDPGETRT